MFIACTDGKGSKEMYNPIIDLDYVIAVDRSNDDVNDYRIMFHTHPNEEEYEWFFDDIKSRDEEYKRIEEILLKIP